MPPPTDDAESGLRDLNRRSIIATLWSTLRALWVALASFILFVVMARLLSPTDFGVYALASAVTEIARILSTVGMTELVVRDRVRDPTLEHTAFWTIVAISLATMAALWFGADHYAALVRAPEVVPFLKALALIMPLSTLPAIHAALLTRDLLHKSLAKQSIVATLAGGIVAVALALQGYGVWALVGQAGTAAVVTTAMLWSMHPWRPRLVFDFGHLRSLLLFGASLSATHLLWILGARLQEVLIARYQGTEAVGLFRVAWRLVDLVGQSVINPVVSVALVTFSHHAEFPAALGRTYLTVVRLAALLAVPSLFGLAATAPLLVPALFGTHWAPAASVAQILCLMGLPLTVTSFFNPALTARGKPQVVLGFTIVQFVLGTAMVWFAARRGLDAAAAAAVLTAIVALLLQLSPLRHHIHVTARTLLSVLWPIQLAAILMAVVVFALLQWPALAPIPVALRIVLSTAFGVLLFGFLMAMFGHDPRRDLLTMRQTLGR